MPPPKTGGKKPAAEYFLPGITGGGIGKRQIIYVGDWSVSSDPIISWDVNYTALSLHVKRQIIEEGKRCATLYLCFGLLLEDLLSLVCPFSSSSFLPFLFFCLQCIYCGVISRCATWSYYSRSLPWWILCPLFTVTDLSGISEIAVYCLFLILVWDSPAVATRLCLSIWMSVKPPCRTRGSTC